MNTLSRRTFLRATGVSLALPFLDAMIPTRARAATAKSPKRMVAINLPLGLYAPKLFPEKAGREYALTPYLEIARELRDDFTIFSGVSHPGVDGGHDAEKSFLTAAPKPGSRSFRNTISLDQLVARQIGGETRFASLTLGEKSLSWSANGVSIPHEGNPWKLYERLFLTGTADEVGAQRFKLRDGQSIMDAVLDEAKSMERKVGARDREKLDQYFTAVRETEERLVKAEKWVETPKPKVEAEPPPQQYEARDFTGRMREHLEVVKLAIQTDSTRVVALSGDGGGLVPPLPGVEIEYHGLSHHGLDPRKLEQLEIIDREMMGIWTDFVKSLKATTENEGTLLDNTQILFGSNLGNAGAHTTTNLPILLAGGGFRHGQHLAFDAKENCPLSNLFVSMLQELGLETDSFASSTGPMSGLEFG